MSLNIPRGWKTKQHFHGKVNRLQMRWQNDFEQKITLLGRSAVEVDQGLTITILQVDLSRLSSHIIYTPLTKKYIIMELETYYIQHLYGVSNLTMFSLCRHSMDINWNATLGNTVPLITYIEIMTRWMLWDNHRTKRTHANQICSRMEWMTQWSGGMFL